MLRPPKRRSQVASDMNEGGVKLCGKLSRGYSTCVPQAMCALGLRCIVDEEFSRWRQRSRNFPGYIVYFSIDIVLNDGNENIRKKGKRGFY